VATAVRGMAAAPVEKPLQPQVQSATKRCLALDERATGLNSLVFKHSIRQPETSQRAAKTRDLMSQKALTLSHRHPNFCRDLVAEPLSSEEWAQLTSWQETQASHKGSSIPARACVVCGKSVPLFRGAITQPVAGTAQLRCASGIGEKPLNEREKHRHPP
jgi:hypothetical protein